MTDFAATKALFHMPDGVIYLDGNSLGPLPIAAVDRLERTLEDEWGDRLGTGWPKAGWMDQPSKLGDRIGKLIGAPKGSVVLGDTLSIKVYQALAAALDMRPDRNVILSDTGNFPSDLYMADGLARGLDKGHRVVTVAPQDVAEALNEDVAVLMLTQVDYRTGRMHDMAALTKAAHAVGAICVWDLAHSAGALPVELNACNADFAVGCGYKYLNGGPGAPAFVFVAKRHLADMKQPLPGWHGHAEPFAFTQDYKPHATIDQMLTGTASQLATIALETALGVFSDVDMKVLRQKNMALGDLFIALVNQELGGMGFELASPTDAERRGSQVSLTHENGYAIMQAVIARGVVGDCRAPDSLRFVAVG